MNRLALRDLHILKFARLVVDADFRRRDPARELAQLRLLLHQALDICDEPLVALIVVQFVGKHDLAVAVQRQSIFRVGKIF